jgi:PAS domain S-box-containing protein
MLTHVSRRDFFLIAAILIGSLLILFALQFGAAVQSIRSNGPGIGGSLYSIFLLASLLAITLIILFVIRLLQIYQEKILQAQAAERRTAIFTAALNTTPIGVLIRDLRLPQQSIVFANQALSDLTGFNHNELSVMPQGFLFGQRPDPVVLTEMRRAIDDRSSTSLTAPTVRKDGSNFWGEWFISPIADRQGQVTHIVKFLMDITTFRRAQEALSLAKEQAIRASTVKANFLATMSHEIRTPINGITGILAVLAEQSLTADQRRLLEIARNSAENLREIVNDILDYSKIEAGKLEIDAQTFDLHALLQSIIDLNRIAAEKKGLILSLEIGAGVNRHVVGDQVRLRQVVLNLVNNAIKYTEHGNVTVRLAQLMEHNDGGQPVGSFRLEVIDTGIGISTTDQQRLFERFTQLGAAHARRASGTGLGLAITKQLTELMGGEIGCDSRPGHGSRFWIMLPLQLAVQHPVAAIAPTTITGPRNVQGARILVAEDNPANLVVVQRYLEKAGCATDCAYNGEEALRWLSSQAYDLVLMDVSMPLLDGFEVTRRVRAEGGPNATKPIIALTAHVMRGDAERCLAAGMNDYLAKPVDYAALQAMLGKWLSDRESVGQPDMAVSQPGQPLSHDRLHYLAHEIGADKLAQVISIYLEDSARRIRRIREACPSRDLAIIAAEAHALKSSSADLGLTQLADLLERLERAAYLEDRVDVYMLLLELDGIYMAGHRQLRTKIATAN